MIHQSKREPMRRRFLTVLMAICVASGPLIAKGEIPSVDGCGSIEAQETIRDSVIIPLFDALRAGHIEEIRRHLSHEMAQEYEKLFTRNPTYGDYLRDLYEGSAFKLLKVTRDGDHYDVDVLVYWADGRSMEVPLELGGSSASVIGVLTSAPCPSMDETH